MAEPASAAIALRESDRREIENQVREFLAKGGKIEQLPLFSGNIKPGDHVWRPGFTAMQD